MQDKYCKYATKLIKKSQVITQVSIINRKRQSLHTSDFSNNILQSSFLSRIDKKESLMSDFRSR